MRRSDTTRGLSLADLAKQPFDNDDADELYQPPPLDAPPVAPPGWAPAPVVKSASDPNIARLPGKLMSRVLTRFLSLLLQRLAGTNQLLALIIAEFVCALRKSEWLMKLVGNSVCRPVAAGIKTAVKERTVCDGLPFIAPNSPMLPSTRSVDRSAACPLSPTTRCSSYARTSPQGCTHMQDADIPPLVLGAAATSEG